MTSAPARESAGIRTLVQGDRDWRSRAPALLALFMLLLAILPFVLLARHAHPSTDDFCIANVMRDLGFWGAAKQWYTQWTGRFIAIVMMNLSPLSFGSRVVYQLIAVAMLTGLLLAIFWLVREVLPRTVATSSAALYALLGLSAYLYRMSSPAEGLYWHTGAVIFTFGAIAAVACVAAAVRAQRRSSASGRWAWATAAGVAGVIAAGSNEVAMLLLGLVLLTLTWLARRAGSPRWHLWLVPLLLVTLGAAADILAPGNARRAEATGGLGGPMGPLIGSAALSAAAVIEWLSSAPLLVGAGAMLVAGAAASSRVAADSPWRRTSWVIPIVVCAVGIWGALFFTHWTSGFTLRPGAPGRVSNVVFLFFLLVATLSAFMIGLQQVGRHGAVVLELARARAWVVLAMAMLLFGQGNIREAYVDLVTGRAATYDKELTERYALLETARSTAGSSVVPPLSRIPKTIFFRDITPDPTDWRNACYASFWAVREVRVSP